jgi:hypothetical protein
MAICEAGVDHWLMVGVSIVTYSIYILLRRYEGVICSTAAPDSEFGGGAGAGAGYRPG